MSNTTKLYGFVGGILLLIILAIGFAIKPTFDLNSEINTLNEKLTLNGNLDQEINELQILLKPLSYSDNKIEWANYNQYALSEITKTTSDHQVKIIQFQPTLSKTYEGFRANLFQIELEGSYVRLLKTLKELEHIAELGEIISSKFFLHKQRKTKKESVHLIIYLQRLEQNEQ